MSFKDLRDINSKAFVLFSSMDCSISNLLISCNGLEQWFSMEKQLLFKGVLGLENLRAIGFRTVSVYLLCIVVYRLGLSFKTLLITKQNSWLKLAKCWGNLFIHISKEHSGSQLQVSVDRPLCALLYLLPCLPYSQIGCLLRVGRWPFQLQTLYPLGFKSPGMSKPLFPKSQ